MLLLGTLLRDPEEDPDTDLDCDGLRVAVELPEGLFDPEPDRLDVDEPDGDRDPRLDAVYV